MDASAYLSQLISLLPPGDALAREPGSVLERLLSVPAAELARVDGRVEALLTESDPARTTEMLADWERALGLPDVCYPNFQFSRASRARYFDGAGVLREAAVDEPRYLFDAQGNRTEAVLVEGAAVNSIRNATGEGAIVGTPGTLPTNWTSTGFDGVAVSVAGRGMESDIPYIDLRYAGTPTTTNAGQLRTETTYPAAAVGQTWTHSSFVRLTAGNTNGITDLKIIVAEWSAPFVLLAQSSTSFVLTPGALGGGRVWHTRLLSAASVTLAVSNITFMPVIGVPVDFTIRIGAPQLELGGAPSSPILNPVGAPAATTRAADQLYIATTQERRARILARLIERFEPTPVAIIGLAARLGDTVTLTEFRPHDCAQNCEAAVLDEPWAHAFQIAGGAQQVMEFTCEDMSETPLSQWRTGRYECAIRRFAPAHTVPIFSYA